MVSELQLMMWLSEFDRDECYETNVGGYVAKCNADNVFTCYPAVKLIFFHCIPD